MNRVKDVNRIFLYTVLVAIGGSLGSALLGIADKSMLAPLLVSQLLLVAPMAIYVIRYRINAMELLRIKKLKWKSVGGVILFAFFINPLLNFLNTVSMLFTSNIIDSTMNRIVFAQPLAVSLIAIALIPCILEESVYRGVFFNEYRKIDPRKGILLSAFLFALLHLNLNQFFYALVMGILFSLLVEATDSILSSMLVHFIINARSVLEVYLLSKAKSPSIAAVPYSAEELLAIIGANVLPVIFSTILAFVVFVYLVKGEGRWEHIKEVCFRRQPGKTDAGGKAIKKGQEKKELLSTKYLLWGIGICAFLMLWGEFS